MEEEGPDDRMCPVCGQQSPANERPRRHYGGICCNRCRSFFLRAHQKTREPAFVCSFGETYD